MSARKDRLLRRAVVGLGTTLLAGALVTGGSATADSGFRYSPGGDCVAKWYSKTNEFWFRDVDKNGKSCVLEFQFKKEGAVIESVWRELDNVNGIFVETKNPEALKYVRFRVCEVKDADWSCTKWRDYLT